MKAFLGTGLLGGGFVEALLDKDEKVHIWNRTRSKAEKLEELGAQVYETPAEAVKGAGIVHLALKDDASVNEVLEKAKAGFEPGTVIIDHTTTSVEGAEQRTRVWKEKGYRYLHAPVLMGPKNARERTGFMLVSGDQELIKEMTPTLSAMTGKLMNLGEKAGKAAAMKLSANLFLIGLNGTVSDTMAFNKATGISNTEFVTLLQDWNPGVAVSGRFKKVEAGNFDQPSWELAMARKDAGLMVDEARKADVPLTVIPAIIQKMDALINAGEGKKDWSIIAKVSE